MFLSEIYESDILLEGINKKVLNAYLDAVLFTSTDDEDEPLDANFTNRDFDKSALNQAKKDLNDFWKKAKDLIKGEDDTQIAHDVWMTRTGQGVGFWDRDYKNDPDDDKGDKLTKIIDKSFKNIDAYVGDDGKIYF